jgi:hypothetical protein
MKKRDSVPARPIANRHPFAIVRTTSGKVLGWIRRLAPIEGLTVSALVGTLLLSGCASIEPIEDGRESETPPETLPFRDTQGGLRTIVVLCRQGPQFAMRAFEPDQRAGLLIRPLASAGLGLGLGALGTVVAYVGEVVGLNFLQLMLMGMTLGLYRPQFPVEPPPLEFSPEVLVTSTLIGGAVGLLWAAADSVPAKSAEEIDAVVLPVLSSFPFQESIVEDICAAGNSETDRLFLDRQQALVEDDLSDDVDAVLEVGSPSVVLQRVKNSLQLSVVVTVQLINRRTGTSLTRKTFSHAWRVFDKNKPAAAGRPLAGDEIEGDIRLLSEDIVDTLFLTEESPTRSFERVPGLWFFQHPDALQPKSPKTHHSLFSSKWNPSTVESLQPRLEWEPFPGQRDKATDSQGRYSAIVNVTYDLRIWRQAEGVHQSWELVYERKGLDNPWHTVEQELENGRTYYWAVRARFVRDGEARATQWTTSGGSLPLVPKEEATGRRGLFSSMLSGPYGFSTPK